MKEVDLAEKVVGWLQAQGWDVYQEVQVYAYSGIADIVATHGFLTWVVECKLSLGINVMYQASRWRSHYRSIAVPAPKRTTKTRRVAVGVARSHFNLGVIQVHNYGGYANSQEVEEVRPAPLMREYHNLSKRITDTLTELHKDYAPAGQAGGTYLTPYRQTAMHVQRFIEQNPGCTIREIFDELGKRHYASRKSAMSTMRTNLETIESDWCRVDKSERPFRYYIRKDKET